MHGMCQLTNQILLNLLQPCILHANYSYEKKSERIKFLSVRDFLLSYSLCFLLWRFHGLVSSSYVPWFTILPFLMLISFTVFYFVFKIDKPIVFSPFGIDINIFLCFVGKRGPQRQIIKNVNKKGDLFLVNLFIGNSSEPLLAPSRNRTSQMEAREIACT